MQFVEEQLWTKKGFTQAVKRRIYCKFLAGKTSELQLPWKKNKAASTLTESVKHVDWEGCQSVTEDNEPSF